ncbi:7-cyano-7-deazaguanine synthase [Neogemmobacter tilapiae]|uniref:7-cyano-7-deazaguanine synthase n=1 Tax=Neogemmobacter tilapiae TaxID=875041 RepID=UPI001678B21D|nr:7-cyano-7-deazaguanine synthase [Gemmobacter tilapiae]
MKVLLFSGGVESTALAWSYRPDRLAFVDYGQIPAAGERRSAVFLADRLGLPLDQIAADISALGAGDMVARAAASHSKVAEAWPFRNQFLITLAAMRYAGNDLEEIMIGTVATDAVHADGTPTFLSRIQDLLQCELPSLQVTAPAIAIDTLTLVKQSSVPRDLLGWTFSCHRATVACGNCRGCNKTIQLFSELPNE